MDATGFGYPLGQIPRMDTLSFKADDRLIELAKESCAKAVTSVGVHVGRVVSGDQFISDKAVKERISSEFADERGTSTEANAVVKDAGKADRKQVQQKQAVVGKDKKLSIHERLEINKRIIQEKQGKDKPERGADRGVR